MKQIKATVFIILSLMLVAALCAFPAAAVDPIHTASDEYLNSQYHSNLQSVKLTGDQRTDVVMVALSQLGYHEGDSDADMGGGNTSGSKNFVEYNRLYGKVDNSSAGETNGYSYGYYWCCSFATWCVKQAGVPVSVVKTEISCSRLITWLKANSTYKTRSSGYTPITGDLIFFKNSSSTATATHVGIVRYADSSKVYTVEGNTSTGDVALRSYELTDTYIVGYGVPAYVTDSSKAFDFSMASGYITGTYFIDASSLNVRSGASTSFSVLGNLSLGDKVTVLSVSGSWGRINFGGRDGWIYLGYAQYVPSAKYTIYYNTNGGEPLVPTQPKGDGEDTVLTEAAPVRDGYSFAGWATTADAKVAEYKAGSVFRIDADTTLYAVWALGEYTVIFYNGDTLLQTGAYLHGGVAEQPVTPTKAPDNTYKYVFAGWDTDGDGKVNVKAGETLNATGNLICHAVFTPEYIEYKVAFYGSDGKTLIEERTYHFGDAVVIPPVANYRDGAIAYLFTGWNTSIAGTVSENASYTAVFAKDEAKYSVSFIDGDGKVMANAECKYGDTVAAPDVVPQKKSDHTYTYKFSGWDRELGAVTEDTVYTAQFDGVYIDYKITFNDGDGKVFAEVTAHYGDNIVQPEAVPTKSPDQMYEYTFSGWDREFIPVTGDTAFTALFDKTERIYTVTFFNDDGTVYKTADYHFGDVIAIPENPSKTSDAGTYTFDGWTPEITPVSGNMNFTAKFSLTQTQKPTDKTDDTEKKGVSVGTIISVVVVVLAAGGFVTYIVIRGKKRSLENKD